MTASHLTRNLARYQRIIIAAHIALAALFSVMVPPWEAHDETGHFAYINHLVLQRTLPNAMAESKVFLDQSHQPPLYYMVAAALTFWVDRSDNLTPQLNIFAFDGTNRQGARLLLRERGEAFPWQGTILALHMARLVSVALGGLMIWLIARSARALFRDRPAAALLTTALAAFNPQVLFMAGMVNNDIMVSVTGAALAYLLITAGTSPPSQREAGRMIALGVVLGLSLLSKNSALIFAPFTAMALLYIAWRQRWSWQQFLRNGLLVAIPVLVLAAPWYASNYMNYGQIIVNRDPSEPITQAPTSLIGEGLLVSVRDGWLPQMFVNAFRTFWGKFGWGNVQMPDLAYTVILALCVVGLAGCVAGVRHSGAQTWRGLLLMVGMGFAMLVLPGYRAIFYQNPDLLPGRYLMPALTAYTALLGFGVAHWFERIGAWIDRRRPLPTDQASAPTAGRLTLALCAGAGMWALAVPFTVIAPAYAPPPVSQTSASDQPPLLRLGDVAEVLAVNGEVVYRSDREGLRQYVRVRLTWRALKETPNALAIGVSVLGRDAEVLGTTNAHPAGGNFPTTNWNPGDTFQDERLVLIERPCPQLPAMGRVNIALFEYELVNNAAIRMTRSLTAYDAAGNTVTPIVGRFRIEAPVVNVPVIQQPPLGMLAGIALVRAEMPDHAAPGDTLNFDLTYETWRANNPDGVAFMHVLNEAGQLVAQDDHPPLAGGYPTDLWQRGECVRESFALTVPATFTGTLRAVTGFYTPGEFTRFPTGQPDDVIALGNITVR
ncbi:MAG: DUF2142 domain-containing protein [Candidatus Roseilinea sp.]|uniref:DUF2142 domain-containing protein n=1 Tax=Candidatus Roseilinea sp. TaxID=2838777 RepID=UPI004049EF53